jgi:hypothetical protein
MVRDRKKMGVRGVVDHTHEEIIGIWTEPADFEKLHQVKKLAMDVAANL